MDKIIKNPLFWGGLALRITLLIACAPSAAIDWYIPFLEASINNLSLDPWSTWLNNNGDKAAFPYGYVMWFIFLPATIIAKLTGMPVYNGYSATLLLADIALMLVLNSLLPKRRRLILVLLDFANNVTK